MASNASLQKGGVPEKGPSLRSQALKSSLRSPALKASQSLSSRSQVSHAIPGLHNMRPGPGSEIFNKQNAIAEIRKKLNKQTQEEKGIAVATKYVNKRAEGLGNRRKLQLMTEEFKSHLRQLNDYVNGKQNFVQGDNLAHTIQIIKTIIYEISNLKTVEGYSWKENGRFGNSNDFMDTQSRQMLNRIEEYVNALIDTNNTSQEMYDITLALFTFASDVLRLYIPEEVNKMFGKLLPRITKWRSENAAVNAHNNAVALQNYLEYVNLIEGIIRRSLAHRQKIEELESQRESTRYKQATPAGGKSIKSKQHRNGKTQKKRQRKNQKK